MDMYVLENVLDNFPIYYRDIYEFIIYSQMWNLTLDEFLKELNRFILNKFISTGDISTNEYFEHILGIVADPTTEDLEFRRERIINRFSLRIPFTEMTLRQKLDEIVGENMYDISFDPTRKILYIDTATLTQNWYDELRKTILIMKPAHIIFINRPTAREIIGVTEEVVATCLKWNHRVNVTAHVSEDVPLTGPEEFGTVKSEYTHSVSQTMLVLFASRMGGLVSQISLNNGQLNVIPTRVSIPQTIEGIEYGTLQLEFSVTRSSGINIVRSIDVLDANGNALASLSDIYVPTSYDTSIIYELAFVEGRVQETLRQGGITLYATK